MMVELDSTFGKIFFACAVGARLLAASWLVAPELAPLSSPYPDLAQAVDQFKLERFVHVGDFLMYLVLIVHYHGNPKLWNHMIWGPLMVILALHHFFEHMTHELLPKEGTMTLVANTVWTTFTCCVYHFYGASYGYYISVTVESFAPVSSHVMNPHSRGGKS